MSNRMSNRTRRQKMILGLVSLVVPLLALGSFLPNEWLWGKASSSDGGIATGLSDDPRLTPPLTVPVLTLGQVDPPRRRNHYRGLLVPSKEADLGFRRSGRVQVVEVVEGERVQARQVLAKLDSSDLAASIKASESQIAEAEAVLAEMVAGPRSQVVNEAVAEVARLAALTKLSELKEQRQIRLKDVNASSEEEYDASKYTVAQNRASMAAAEERLDELREGTRAEQLTAQRAKVDALRANLQLLQVQISETEIVAPFSGIIARRTVDEGAVVGPETSILRLIQVEPLEAKFGVSASDTPWLSPGAAVTVLVDGEPWSAAVSRVEPELDAATRTQAVYVTLATADNQWDSRLAPGRTVTLAFDGESPSETELWLPLAALSRSHRGLWAVMVLVEEATDQDTEGVTRVERRDVQVREIEGDYACLVDGLVQRGDRVLSQALHRVAPGMRVQGVEDSTIPSHASPSHANSFPATRISER